VQDRIEYHLRNLVFYDKKPVEFSRNILSSLRSENGTWFFANFESAKTFAETFEKINRIFYAGIITAVMFSSLGRIISHSIKKGYLDKSDIWKDDKFVMNKLQNFRKIENCNSFGRILALWSD